jgi:hypothetical protein
MSFGHKLKALLAVEVLAILSLNGCAYRRSAVLFPTQERLQIVATSPEQYHLRVWSDDHQVAPDGRMKFELRIPPRGCGVYLFNRIPLQRTSDRTKEKVIFVLTNGKALAKLSLRDLSSLPVDGEGYHQLILPQASPSK